MINSYRFFSLSLRVQNKRTINKSKPLLILNKCDYKNKKINIGNVLEELNIYNLLDFLNIKPQNSLYNYHINVLNKNIENHINAIKRGTQYAFKSNILKHVIIYYPFIRYSEITKSFIFTHFTFIEYMDGSSTFWITEAIPNKICSLEDITNYINGAILDVRRSVYIHSDIYTTYADKPKPNLFTVIINYILDLFIEKNFGMKISNKKLNLGICTRDKLLFNNNLKENNKKNIYYNNEFTVVSNDINNYNKYIKKGLSNLYSTQILLHMLNNFKKLNKKNKPNAATNKKLDIIGKYLLNASEKENLDIDDEVKLIIKDKLLYTNRELGKYISECLGVFTGSFINKIAK